MSGVQINLRPERARELQHGLSDIACWARGYVCALPPDDRAIFSPIGIEEVRDLNIIIKGALADYENHVLTPTEREVARLRRWLHRIDEALSPSLTTTKVEVQQAIMRALAGAESPERGLGEAQ